MTSDSSCSLLDPRATCLPTPTVGVSLTLWIETMNPFDAPRPATHLEQVYLLDRDAGLLCRILGLYAARAIDVAHVDYAHAAQDVMKLSVRVRLTDAESCEAADSVRVLVAKASTLTGVIAAAEQYQPAPQRHSAAEV